MDRSVWEGIEVHSGERGIRFLVNPSLLQRIRASDPGLDDDNGATLPPPAPDAKGYPRPFTSETLSHSELVWMWADVRVNPARKPGSIEELVAAIGTTFA